MSARVRYDLQGNLEQFPADLLFQMMSLGHSSGALTLQRGRRKVQVYFERGQLTFAHAPHKVGNRLGDELVRRGRIDAEARDAAVRAWLESKDDRRIGTVFVERGLISREELEEFVREHIKMAMSEALEWQDGRFRFETAVLPESEDILMDVRVEALLLECMTRLDHARREQAERV